MRFSLDLSDGSNIIRAYGEGWVTVNTQELRRSVIILPDWLITDWPPQSFEELEQAHLDRVAALEPEIVLLGTGGRQQFPHPRLTRTLLGRGVGVEVMDTPAACRTYNIIMAEGRRVAAALLMI